MDSGFQRPGPPGIPHRRLASPAARPGPPGFDCRRPASWRAKRGGRRRPAKTAMEHDSDSTDSPAALTPFPPPTLDEARAAFAWPPEPPAPIPAPLNPDGTRRLYAPPSDTAPPHVVSRLDRDAAKLWDAFYGVHASRFFKDRHYLADEFCALRPTGSPRCILEAGCGAGNAVYPLLALDAAATIYCCDFSARAVALVAAHPAFDPARVFPFVHDLSSSSLPRALPGGAPETGLPESGVDAVTLLFVLSAMSPPQMTAAVSHAGAALGSGGRLLIRDYASGDLAESRLESRGGTRRLGPPGFYARGDGTRAYFFSPAALAALLASAGLEVESLGVVEAQVTNRAKGVTMDRRWVQAVARRPP